MDASTPHFFNPTVQILSRKRSAFDVPDLPGLWRIHWQFGNRTIVSTFYTRHDQACMLWSVTSAAIFLAVQFLTLSWAVQAILTSGLTLATIVSMVVLTQQRVVADKLNDILYCWIVLMLVGLGLTDLSVFLGWGGLLIHLCPLWLGLNAIGYLYTGLRLRSRAFLLLAMIHLVTIVLLPYVSGWQFLTTGVVIAGSVWLVGELRWDWVCENSLRFDRSDAVALPAVNLRFR